MRRIDRLTVALAFIVLGCDPETPPPIAGADTRVADASHVADPSDASALEGPAPLAFGTTASDLFAPRNLPRFELTLPAERWASMQAHALDEQWETATLRYDGALVGPITIRFKGGFGSLLSCVDDAGTMKCSKLSMKLKFSDPTAERRFFGLKRLNLHSMVNDPSQMRERLAYAFFAGLGIPTPRSGYATVVVNGQSYGLYAMVEAIDGRFTEDRWPGAGNGNLFQAAWPITDDALYYQERLATNEESGDVRTYVAVARDLRSVVQDPVRLRATASRHFDLDEISRVLAALDAIGDWDGLVNFVCGNTPESRGLCANNNFFVYQDERQPRFTVIPWDMDNTFQYRGAFQFAPHWTTPAAQCPTRFLWDHGIYLASPGCDPLFSAIIADLSVYRATLAEILRGPLAPGEIERQIDRLAAQLSDEVARDPRGPGLENWRAAVDSLRASLTILRDRAARLRDGRSVAALSVDPDAVNDFESYDPFAAFLGVESESNATTSFDFSVDEPGANLFSGRALRIDFDFRNPADESKYGAWGLIRLPFLHGSTSLSGRHLRFRASSDRTRSLRLELYGAVDSGAVSRPGWDLVLGPTPQTFDLPLERATYTPGVGPAPPVSVVLGSLRSLVLLPQPEYGWPSGLVSSDGDRGVLHLDDLRFE